MEKVLVVGPSWVGDMVMAQSLFKQLKQSSPELIIDVLAPEWSKPILARMPEVRQAIVLPTNHGELKLANRWRLGVSLRSEAYTQAIVLPRSWKSALAPYAANIPLRTGFHGEQRFIILNDRRRLDKKQLDQTVKRFYALGLRADEALGDIPYPKLSVDPNNQQQLISKYQLNRQLPAIALMPGAEYGPAKQWPLSHFKTLAETLAENGYQVWIIGGTKDKTAGEKIAESGKANIYNLCGSTSLSDAVDLLALTQQAVTNDSGLMHVAAAVGTFVQGIYGSSSPKYTPPLTDKHKIHSLSLECSPCFKRNCPLGHTNCLNHIQVEAIIKGIEHAIHP